MGTGAMTDRTTLRAGAFLAALAVGACSKSDINDQPIEPTIEPAAPGEDTAPLTPPRVPVYYGVWAVDKELCDLAPGSAAASPIAFAEGEFIGFENRCRIDAAQEGTEGGYRINLVCMAEGVETVETVDVDVDGEMLRIRRSEGAETVFVRCEGED